jgi:two-component system NtrC family response regulator
MVNVLVIDDDQGICETLMGIFNTMGYNAACAGTIAAGISLLKKRSFDVVLLDVVLPDGNGLNILSQIKEMPLSPEVVIITGEGDPHGAELAILSGAWDYIQKPLSMNQMILTLKRVLQYREENRKSTCPEQALRVDNIIGKSPRMLSCLESLAQAAGSRANILITGETGTGKELFARAIHENSFCRDQSMVVVDCASLPESLVGSILFGHEKGSYTGAHHRQEGLVKQADGGTLFLDEVGELPMSLQKTFLRVLQEKKFRPIGSRKELDSSFRLIAATNRNLGEMVNQGTFREDLLYRLQSLHIEIPALRDRSEDIKDLAVYYEKKISDRYELENKRLSPEYLNALEAYQWPGNVRELKNAIEVSIINAKQALIMLPQHLPHKIRIHVTQKSVHPSQAQESTTCPAKEVSQRLPTLKDFRKRIIEENEKLYILRLLDAAEGNMKNACRIAGLGRSRLYSLMKQHQIARTWEMMP